MNQSAYWNVIGILNVTELVYKYNALRKLCEQVGGNEQRPVTELSKKTYIRPHKGIVETILCKAR